LRLPKIIFSKILGALYIWEGSLLPIDTPPVVYEVGGTLPLLQANKQIKIPHLLLEYFNITIKQSNVADKHEKKSLLLWQLHNLQFTRTPTPAH
jgi:hypothetical protein